MMEAILFAMLWLVQTVVTYSVGAVAIVVVGVGAFTALQTLRVSNRGHRPLEHLGGM